MTDKPPYTSPTRIKLGPLSQDQQDYLARLRETENSYDGSRVVGGPFHGCPRCGARDHYICIGG